jgi:lysophospholipase L1-like esterase
MPRIWPDFLAERLLENGMGENTLARFERDVLSQSGVKTAIVLMGINDIGWPGSALAPDKKTSRGSADRRLPATDCAGTYPQGAYYRRHPDAL